MTITTLTSRELNQDIARAKRAAKRGPVIITRRGKPEHVLLSVEQYQNLTGHKRNIADVLAGEGTLGFEFNPPKARITLSAADLS